LPCTHALQVTQYLIRMRKLELKATPKLVTMPARCAHRFFPVVFRVRFFRFSNDPKP
jgi:hypothetical protein